MSESERPFDPKATIQVRGDEVAEVSSSSTESEADGSRRLPPPLPAYTPQRHVEPSPAPGPGRGGRTILYSAILIVMLGVAAFGGMKFASLLLGDGANQPAPTTAAPVPAPTQTMTLPTVEVR